MRWLLDTCAISEYAYKAPTQTVIAWLDEQDEASLYLSAMSIAEIEKGIVKLRAKSPRRAQRLAAWLSKVEHRFAGRILPLDTDTLRLWAQLTAHSEVAGRPLPVMDALIMACARRHGLTLVTRNVRDFSPHIEVFNPWA